MRTVQFDDLWAAWPRTGERELLTKTLQGDLAAFDPQNFEDSVVRLSTAFNKAGHPVKKSSNFTGETYRDKDGLLYMTRAEEMKRLLTDVLGRPRHVRSDRDALGFKGIILFENVKSLHGKSHFDLWNMEEPASVNGGTFFTEAGNILMWTL
jgi:hypothetical protein